jgi:hypothetical protein
VRSLAVLALALSLCACGFVDQILADGPSAPSNKVYLGRADVIFVPARETHRYECIQPPLLCTHSGVNFECRCSLP